MSVDPGYANGCKCAVIDLTGQCVEFQKLFLSRKREFVEAIRMLINKYNIDVVGVGDGLGSRDAECLVAEAVRPFHHVRFCSVREAGVSVYSCSVLANKEFPGVDPGERSAISLARRLLDPMAELVKVSPENLGVGQYQHDINAKKMMEALDDAVEQCVSFVGVDLNTAGEHLLARVAGVGTAKAKNIIQHRTKIQRFTTRDELLKVKGIGAKSYKQAAGFLRIFSGKNKLDGTWIHPESYHLAAKVLKQLKMNEDDIGSSQLKRAIQRETNFESLKAPPEILSMILDAFRKDEEDVRDGRVVQLRREVIQIGQLRVGAQFSGHVTNSTTFGCFVNIGVQKDGLIHNSKLRGRQLIPNQAVTVRIEQIKGDRIGLILVDAK